MALSLPVLITSGDLLPGGGDLNGRWAGQQLHTLLKLVELETLASSPA